MAHRKSSSGSRKRTSPKVWLLTVFVGLLVAGLSLWWEEQQQKPAEALSPRIEAVEEPVSRVQRAEKTAKGPKVAGVIENGKDAADTKGAEAVESVAYELARLQSENHGQVGAERQEQVIEHIGYTVSYNPEWRVPNWVAYELTDFESGGEEKRSNHFLPDPLVEGDPVVTGDYKNSGYDRGHMAPAADMKWSEQAMRESFYMTNMCPQLHNLNAGDWKSLEDMGREWARKYGSVYIACGPIVEEGFSTIGTVRKIAIPSAFFKVFLRSDGEGWTSIGFVMPNEAGSKPLMTYMLPVNEIEARTGIDFFYLLPDDVEEQVEGRCEPSEWALKRR